MYGTRYRYVCNPEDIFRELVNKDTIAHMDHGKKMSPSLLPPLPVVSLSTAPMQPNVIHIFHVRSDIRHGTSNEEGVPFLLSHVG